MGDECRCAQAAAEWYIRCNHPPGRLNPYDDDDDDHEEEMEEEDNDEQGEEEDDDVKEKIDGKSGSSTKWVREPD